MISGIIKKDITIYGVFNILVYIVISFILLPILHIFLNIKISTIHYFIWYFISILYTIYIIHIIRKDKKQSNIDKVIYNWFIRGGYSSYQDIFILTEKEPLFEYGLMFLVILIPVGNGLSIMDKFKIILYKIAILHILSSIILMDWKDLVVNYEFRFIDNPDSIISTQNTYTRNMAS
jgi:hypothetical protein